MADMQIVAMVGAACATLVLCLGYLTYTDRRG